MPVTMPTLDVAALVFFVAVWGGYNVLFQGRFQPANSLNGRMRRLRHQWMLRLLEREHRIVDAHLNGVSTSTCAFFASATMIVIAALAGALTAAEQVHAATDKLTILLTGGPQELFELKLFTLIAIFVYAFFKFTWAIRHFNYFSAVIGGAPCSHGTPADEAMAGRMEAMRTLGVTQLNAGLRAYYFALALLGWFIHPLVFMAATALIAAVLVRRQLFSRTTRAIADLADHHG